LRAIDHSEKIFNCHTDYINKVIHMNVTIYLRVKSLCLRIANAWLYSKWRSKLITFLQQKRRGIIVLFKWIFQIARPCYRLLQFDWIHGWTTNLFQVRILNIKILTWN